MGRRVYLFADEAGNFDFTRKPGASKYFMLGSVWTEDPTMGFPLLRLRHDLARNGMGTTSTFHASEDAQAVRNAVFAVIQQITTDWRFDITLLEKAKARPSIRATDERFYKTVWYLHFKKVMQLLRRGDEILVVAASLKTKRERKTICADLEDVVAQHAPGGCTWGVCFWPAMSDPCLQVADYCTWAVQRKWDGGDERSYNLIKSRLTSEFDAFRHGSKLYY